MLRVIEQSRLCAEAHVRMVNFIVVIFGKDFCEGIIPSHWQFPAQTVGESHSMAIVEPFENAMAKQATGAKERLIDVSGGAVDRANNLEPEKIGEHPIGEI